MRQSALELLSELANAGVEFSVEGRRLGWRNSRGLITPDVRLDLADGKAEIIELFTKPPMPVPRRFTAMGRPVTWTGRVVSWAGWRSLSDWDRFGPPEGAGWCGICRAWVQLEGHVHAEIQPLKT